MDYSRIFPLILLASEIRFVSAVKAFPTSFNCRTRMVSVEQLKVSSIFIWLLEIAL